MIEVRYKGRLGNNMFQYCLGRIIAEELGFALQAESIAPFPNTSATVIGARHLDPEQVLVGHKINLPGILADRSPRKIILDGWFQSYEYLRAYRSRIREWLEFDPTISVPTISPAVVVHVRRTDYIWLNWALPFSYYEAAINHFSPRTGELWVVTDDKSDPFFRQFDRWEPKYFSGTAAQDMLFMARARLLIMSQSTFSWWPTFLGNPVEVVCPLASFGAWSKFGGEAGDANLIERDRFTCLECHSAYEPTSAERRHQQIRALKRRIVLALNSRLGFSLPEPPI